jgi:hypothetical protein
MSTGAIMIMMIAVVAVVVLALASQRSGPRVTTIETRREGEEGDE